MITEQINIAIAESLGIHFESSTGCWHQKGFGYLSQLPNYAASLDACAEFEAAMDTYRWWEWVDNLTKVCGGGIVLCISASAPQRCEAYLRTIGKWTPTSTQQPT